MRKSSWLSRLALSIVMLSIACTVAVPFYYIIVNTFKTQQQTSVSPLGFPTSFNFTNYKNVWDNIPVLQSFWNTLRVTAVSVVLMLLFGSMAAYSVVMRKTRSSKRIHIILLLALAVPFQVTLIPIYQAFVKFHLIDSLNGLIVIYTGGAVFSYFLIQGYMLTIPYEIIEAARIDGCGTVRMYWRIVVPLIRPVLVTVSIFQTIWVWNDFLAPSVFIISPSNYTLVLQAYQAVGQYTTNWPAFMTLTVLSLIPITIFFAVMQRHIVGGFTAGAVKG
ncbi:MAG: carbohydrate ABC transporter permease [Acidimicrobiales bacterium]|jgi:raffinose/stachyose/melibiose transport system permease protein